MRAYKYRIYPNKKQKLLLTQHFGCSRHVYNWALSEKEKHYKETGKSLSKRNLQDRLVASKKRDKPWLNKVNSQSLLASLANLDKAFSNFFKGRAKFPRFKSKYAGWQSFQCPQNVSANFESNTVDLPKIKGIKSRLHRGFEGKIKTVTIKRSPSGKFFASVLVDEQVHIPISVTVDSEYTLGLDVGLEHMLIDSHGKKTENPRFLKDSLNSLAVEQRRLSRKKQDSSNRAKQRRRVATVHEKVSNRRYDFIQKETAVLVNKSHVTTFAVEDLNIKSMVKNRKLSRAINDVSWGTFLSVLEYKCRWNGKNLVRIGRFQPSSKLCSECGIRKEKLPLSVRSWQCQHCQTLHDRDVNAAKNIRNFALADAPGHGVCVKSSSVAKPVSPGATAKGVEDSQHGSQEAPTTTALAV